MPTPFLSSEEYDERAHQLYNEGQYDEALDVLREGLGLYPSAVELHVGVGYARLAREEFAWARRAFEEALMLDPDHEDALAGLGETLLRFGQLDADHAEARIYLGNILYDRGEYEAALYHLDRTSPEDHWDELGIWRLVELKKSVYRLKDDDPELKVWDERLGELSGEPDDIDE